MKYTKVRNVKTPTIGTSLSAGIDFFVPEDVEAPLYFDSKFLTDTREKNPKTNINIDSIELYPQERVLIPSGIHVNFTDLYIDLPSTNGSISLKAALIAHNKSGQATKKGLDRLAEVVDQDYQGEMHISVVNTGTSVIKIYPGEKLIQFLLVPIFNTVLEPIQELKDLYDSESDRGNGGFGSTGV